MHIKISLPRLNFIFFIHFSPYCIILNKKNKKKIKVTLIQFTLFFKSSDLHEIQSHPILKTISATCFMLIFDEKIFWTTFILKVDYEPINFSWLKVKYLDWNNRLRHRFSFLIIHFNLKHVAEIFYNLGNEFHKPKRMK
jgi:hypothetical protein